MSEQQAVADEADAGAQPPVEDSGAQESLDEILKEYEDSTPEPMETSQSEAQTNSGNTDNSDVIEWVRQEREARMRETTQRDLKTAVEVMKESAGETPVEIPDEVFEGLLYKRAESDPRVMRAWIKRTESPEGWNKVLKTFGKEIAGKFSKTDKRATDDWNAVESAVHSASTTQPSGGEPDFTSMTDAEFAQYKSTLRRRS